MKNSSITGWLKLILYEVQIIRYKDALCLISVFFVNCMQITNAIYVTVWFILKYVSKYRQLFSYWACIISVWLLGLFFFNYAGFASLWVILSLFYCIFANLGDRKDGEMSAYSVFNKGFHSIVGSLTADQFDRQIRQVGNHNINIDDNDEVLQVDNNNNNIFLNEQRPHRRQTGKERRLEDRLMRQLLEKQNEIG